jgi:hypothetical protein
VLTDKTNGRHYWDLKRNAETEHQSLCGISRAQKPADKYVSQQKGTHTQRNRIYTESASTSSGEQGGKQVMDVYDKIADEMETSWDIMCESEREKVKA